MGHIQRKHLDELVPVPSGVRLKQLNHALGPLWERALIAEQETLTLANLRDNLLPKLMSGQLTVKQAESLVEDVT
jgi:type I restriction enzyme S subunit